jgi:CMP-N-acetylneuraminic acid synthetase
MKGHSERAPNKNIRDFAGRGPLFRQVYDLLAACERVAEIIIDTDSPRIMELAEGLPKVKIVERPKALHGDLVSMNDIIAHDLTQAAHEHLLQTHSTNPLLSKATLEAATERYFQALPEHDSLFSVTARQNRFYWPDGRPVNHNPEELLRTQDLPPLYEENSCFYFFSPESFHRANRRRIGQRPVLFPMSKLEAVDIDDEDDFALAEALARRLQRA